MTERKVHPEHYWDHYNLQQDMASDLTTYARTGDGQKLQALIDRGSQLNQLYTLDQLVNEFSPSHILMKRRSFAIVGLVVSLGSFAGLAFFIDSLTR